MNFRTSIFLFVAVCVVGGLIWLMDHYQLDRDRYQDLKSGLFEIDAADVKEIILERGALRIHCVKRDGRWKIESPLSAAADAGQIERILDVTGSIAKDEVITPAQRKSRGLMLNDYGLMDPRARLVVDTGLSRKDLLIGYEAPLGSLMYVMFAGADNVIGVHRSLFDILPESTEALRDRTLFHGDIAGVSRVEIQRAASGFIQVRQINGEWVMRQPVSAPADGARIIQMLDLLFSLKVSSFVKDSVVSQPVALSVKTTEAPSGAVPRIDTYGLSPDTAELRITLWMTGDDAAREMIVGRDADGIAGEVYARMIDSDSIYAVSNSVREVFAVAVNDLRGKDLFSIRPERVNSIYFKKQEKRLILNRHPESGWSISDPVQWRADNKIVNGVLQQIISAKIATFMGVLPQTNLVECGLMPENFSILISTNMLPVASVAAGGLQEVVPLPQAGVQPVTGGRRLLIGNTAAEGKTVYVRFEDSDEIFMIPVEAIQGISGNLFDPLVYRDRVVFAVMPEKVRRISIIKADVEQTVALQADGSWAVNGSHGTNMVTGVSGAKVDNEAIADILFNVSNLRAVRIEAHNPKSLVEYGLDKPPDMLTLGLSADEGIQKSLMFGFVSGADGRYAMVQGQDVVFVIDGGLVDQLIRGIIIRQSVKRETDDKAR